MSPKFVADVIQGVLAIIPEAATGGVLQNKVFLEISQISQENSCIGLSFYGTIIPTIIQILL